VELPTKYHFGVEIGPVDLADEFPAPPARRDYVRDAEQTVIHGVRIEHRLRRRRVKSDRY
jgi:hypothetical protein